MRQDIETLFRPKAVAPHSDRRLSVRMMRAWSHAATGSFPTWAEMRRADLGGDWNWVFVVDLKLSVGFPYFIYLGQNLAKLSEVYLTGADDWTLSLLDCATREVDAVSQDQNPNLRSEELVLSDGRKIQFRTFAAPLAEDGERITHVFGAANGRFA